jgi:hypothetical protein
MSKQTIHDKLDVIFQGLVKISKNQKGISENDYEKLTEIEFRVHKNYDVIWELKLEIEELKEKVKELKEEIEELKEKE